MRPTTQRVMAMRDELKALRQELLELRAQVSALVLCAHTHESCDDCVTMPERTIWGRLRQALKLLRRKNL